MSDLLLFDRIEFIKTLNDKYDLLNNSYLSFSGGKDSTILHYLLDMALPNNNIPRVFVDTGFEYKSIVNFVYGLSIIDKRFIIIKSNRKIIPTLNMIGYPFKSKYHSHLVDIYQTNGDNMDTINYFNGKGAFKLPLILKYQFRKGCTLRISDKCCDFFKKQPLDLWQDDNHKNIAIIGIRKSEGGRRSLIHSCVKVYDNNHIKISPLLVVDDSFEKWFIDKYNIKLCDLYYEPYNFTRTGCKGCPFNPDLQITLDTLKLLLPNEYQQCEIIWKPVYDEYRRINYRLKNV